MEVLNAASYASAILAKRPEQFRLYAYRDVAPVMLGRVRSIALLCERHGVPLAAAAHEVSLPEPRITLTIIGYRGHPTRVRRGDRCTGHTPHS